MKTYTYFLIFFAIISFTITPGCINENKEETFKEYSLNIETYSIEQYELILPIVKNDNNVDSELVPKIENENLKIINSEKGVGFKILSKGNYSINKKMNIYEPGKLIFSMREIKNIDNKPKLLVWIYYNGTNSLFLSMRCYTKQRGDISTTHEEKCEKVEINGIGWNQIELQSEGGGD